MTHASLFSGIGAAEIAAEWLGWTNVFNCEINEFCRKILKYWFPDAKQYEDIKQTDFSCWKGAVDVISGGFPCQPFSVAGKRRGAEDDRYLWPEMLRVIKEVGPAWVVGENVAGIATMTKQVCESSVESHATINILSQIIEDLRSIGYAAQPVLIPACAVGAPHRRDRIFIIAHCAREFLERNDNETTKRHRKDKSIQFGSQAEINVNERIIARTDWKNFATVAPFCSRNDGLPFDVDRLAIPFFKWRRLTIEAYGNAIVPQVLCEIFRCIDKIENA